MTATQNRGSQFLSIITTPIAKTVYPHPALGAVTDDSQVGWGFQILSGSTGTPFLSGDKDAIIYAVIGVGGNSTLEIQTIAGATLSQFTAGASGISGSYNLGPKGMRVPGGFRLVTDTAATSWVVVYDIV